MKELFRKRVGKFYLGRTLGEVCASTGAIDNHIITNKVPGGGMMM